MARKTYLSRAEITPEFLDEIAEETPPVHREVLMFAERVEHPQTEGGKMVLRVMTTPYNKLAPIVGFADRALPIGGDSFRDTLVEPFHLKPSTEYNATTPGASKDAQGGLNVPAELIASDTMKLEAARLNSLVEMTLAMVGSKAYAYADNPDPDKATVNITVSYAQEIPDLTAAGGGGADDFSGAAPKSLFEIQQMKTEYSRLAGNMGKAPDTVFCGPTTYATLLQSPDIKDKHQPIQPSDPDLTGNVFEGFTYGGLDFICWRHDYMTASGLVEPLPDGITVVTRAKDPAMGLPIRVHAMANLLNDQDASAPKFMFDGAAGIPESPQARLICYDNFVVAPAARNRLAHWRVYTP